MKPAHPESRKEFILDYMREHTHADVSQLSRELGVSEMTIRRDLAKLEQEQHLVRVYGGARILPRKTYEAPLDKRLGEQFPAKDRIGAYAARLVRDGDVIALDASSTCYALARYIEAQVSVITNNLSVAQILCEKEAANIILLGGQVNKASLYTVSFDPSSTMSSYHVDKAFVSAKSVNLAYGLTDALPMEGEVKKSIIRAAQEVYVMADHTKLDTCAFYKVCGIDGIHHLITDRSDETTREQQEFLDHCRAKGVRVHVVD